MLQTHNPPKQNKISLQEAARDNLLVNTILAERKLRSFIEQAWHVLEPSTPFIGGWHIDCISEHLQAVSDGQITKLVVNIPPRHMKSLEMIMWNAWEWGPAGKPYTRWLCSSYAEGISTRDALKARRLIQSPWYQLRWGSVFSLAADQNQKTRFENNHHGYRIATTVRGAGTGEGGDRIVVDDPHNVIKGESELDRLMTLRWWDESMSTRGNHPINTARVIVMQRVHDKDLSGHVLAKDIGYEHLCLPARYEKERPKFMDLKTSIMKKDPRTEEGEVLWEGLYDDANLKVVEQEMTEHARAGQFQQRPTPRGGGIFRVENFKLIDHQPHRTSIKKAVRYWDKAATEGGGKRTAGTLMVITKDNRTIICDCDKGQWGSAKREKKIKQHAVLDDKKYENRKVHVVMEQEPGSGGKDSIEASLKNLMGHVAKKDLAVVDKVTRSEPYQAAIENGLIELVAGDWVKEFIEEHEKAPAGEFKDQWDSASGAFNYLHNKNKSGKTAGTWGKRKSR